MGLLDFAKKKNDQVVRFLIDNPTPVSYAKKKITNFFEPQSDPTAMPRLRDQLRYQIEAFRENFGTPQATIRSFANTPKASFADSYDWKKNPIKKAGATIAQETINTPIRAVRNIGQTTIDALDMWNKKELDKRKAFQIAGRTSEQFLDALSFGKGKAALDAGKALVKGSKPFTETLIRGGKQGLKTGMGYGAGYGASIGAQDENATAGSVAQNAAIGTLFGGGIGAAAGGVLPAIGSFPPAIKNSIRNRRPGQITSETIPSPTLGMWGRGVLDALPRPGMSIEDVSRGKGGLISVPKEVKAESRFSERVTEKLGKENPVEYEKSVNDEILKKAKANLAIGRDFALKQARNKNLGPEANATAMELVDDAIKGEKWEILDDLLKEFSPRFTKEGQNIQILSRWGRMTPTGAVRYTQHLIDKAQEMTGKKIEFSPQAKADIVGLAKNVMATSEGSRERAIASALLMRKMVEQVPTSLGKKISTIQTMAQLLNPKTAIRNIGGNVLFAAGEAVSDVVATPIDMATSLFTGKRTKTLPSLPTLARGFVRGGKEAAEEVALGIDTKGLPTQFDIGQTPTFRGKAQNFEKALGYELRVPDRAFYQAAFDDSLRQQMKLSGVKSPTKEMIETAHFDGLYRTFQDESLAAKFFVKMKKGLNFGKDFGAGDLVLKYPKTPGNILARALDYSPAGYLKAIFELAKPAFGKPFNQKAFVEALSRGSVGGLGLFGLGYILNEMGIVSGRPNSDKDINAVERSQGGGGYRINLSALKRLVLSGFDQKKAKPQEGDTMITYDWIQPFAVPFSMGANVSETGKFAKTGQVALESLESGVNTIMEQPLVSGVKKLVGYGDFIGGAGETLKGAAASFVPTLLNQIRQYTDNTARETRGGGLVNEGINLIKNKIPVVASTLPEKYTVWGEKMETYQNGGNSLFNVFINPAFISTLQSTPAGKEVMGIYERSGETQQAPRTVKKSVIINGESRDLSGEEISAYQKYVGEKTAAIFDQLVNDSEFQALSDEEKAKKMAGILTDINTAAKVELFGHKAKLNKRTRSILSGQWDGKTSVSDETVKSLKSNLSSYKKLGDLNGWLGEAEALYEKYGEMLQSGDLTDEEALRIRAEMKILKEQFEKYTGFKGFTRPKTGAKPKKISVARQDDIEFILKKMNSRLKPLRAFSRPRTNLASVSRPTLHRPKFV